MNTKADSIFTVGAISLNGLVLPLKHGGFSLQKAWIVFIEVFIEANDSASWCLPCVM